MVPCLCSSHVKFYSIMKLNKNIFEWLTLLVQTLHWFFFFVAVLKEELEDLTHLAPTAGDVCVPLDESPIDYVLPDMLDDIILSDPNLLSSGPNTRGSPLPHSASTSSSSPDSFFSCKDELEPSSRPHSPILTQVINF